MCISKLFCFIFGHKWTNNTNQYFQYCTRCKAKKYRIQKKAKAGANGKTLSTVISITEDRVKKGKRYIMLVTNKKVEKNEKQQTSHRSQ